MARTRRNRLSTFQKGQANPRHRAFNRAEVEDDTRRNMRRIREQLQCSSNDDDPQTTRLPLPLRQPASSPPPLSLPPVALRPPRRRREIRPPPTGLESLDGNISDGFSSLSDWSPPPQQRNRRHRRHAFLYENDDSFLSESLRDPSPSPPPALRLQSPPPPPSPPLPPSSPLALQPGVNELPVDRPTTWDDVYDFSTARIARRRQGPSPSLLIDNPGVARMDTGELLAIEDESWWCTTWLKMCCVASALRSCSSTSD
jgi:hypothetical protein